MAKYKVTWTENGKKRCSIFLLYKTAVVFYRGLIVDYCCYDAVLRKTR
jgi:hypothetical protein